VRHAKWIVVTMLLVLVICGSSSALASHGIRGTGYRAALAAQRAEARRAAELREERRAERRERLREKRQIVHYSKLYGHRVGRWWPLCHEWFPGREREALYVMSGESGGDEKAGRTNGFQFCGLWQLWRGHLQKFREVTGHAFFWGVLVPEYNAEMTAHMTKRGRDWSAWPNTRPPW
jgi:hypothetical protein